MGRQVVLKCWQGITTTHRIIAHKCAVLNLQSFEENLDCLILKMKSLCFFKVSITIYQSKWHNIPENLNVCQHLKWEPWIFQCEVCLKFSECLFLLVHTEMWVFGYLTFFSTAINKMCMIDWLIFQGMFWDSTCQAQFSVCPVCSIGTTYVTDASIKRIQKLLVGYSFFYDDFLWEKVQIFTMWLHKCPRCWMCKVTHLNHTNI